MTARAVNNGVLGVGFVLVYHTAIVAAAQSAPVLAPLAAGDIGADPRHVAAFTAIVFAVALLSSNGTAGLLTRYGSWPAAAASLVFSAAGVGLLAVARTPWAALAAAILIGISYGPVNPVGSRVITRVTSGRRQNLIFSLKQSSVAIGGAATAAGLPVLALAFGWRVAAVAVVALCLFASLLAVPTARLLGGDGDPRASARFAWPVRPALALLADSGFRGLAFAVTAFSMAQFGFMSVYVTMLWRQTGISPELAGGMMSVTMLASIAGRLFWGWRADGGSPRRVLAGLAGAGTVVLVTTITLSPDWGPVPLAILSLALGLGPMSWSGVLLAEVARAGAARDGQRGIVTATAGTMVFAYFGGLIGPGLLAISTAATGDYQLGTAVIAASFLGTALVVARMPDTPVKERSA